MKKILLVLLVVLMTLGLIISCKSDPEIKYVEGEGVDINKYMLKKGCEVDLLNDCKMKYWCDDLKINVTSVTSVTFTKDKPGFITSSGTDMTYEGTGKVLGYVSGTDVYIVGEKILGNYDCGGMFYNFTSLTNIDFGNFDTNKIRKTSLLYDEAYGFFEGCESLEKLDLSNWDTSNFTDMIEMFMGCTSLTDIKGIENFNTSNVIYMTGVFHVCESLEKLDLSNWDTSHVSHMEDMFHSCSSLTALNLTSFNITTNSDRPEINFDGWVIFESCGYYTSDTDRTIIKVKDYTKGWESLLPVEFWELVTGTDFDTYIHIRKAD